MEGLFLLWFDDSAARSLEDKVARAAARYRLKFGQAPTVCYVHPTMMAPPAADQEQVSDAGGVRVLARRTVLPHHLMVGLAE